MVFIFRFFEKFVQKATGEIISDAKPSQRLILGTAIINERVRVLRTQHISSLDKHTHRLDSMEYASRFEDVA